MHSCTVNYFDKRLSYLVNDVPCTRVYGLEKALFTFQNYIV